ncbi:MAG: ABC transporter substrate-binding protein [Clostridia bacterium]|nr:ABC transporter substrate-binding protein [Clostridia bacterium]
MKSVKKWFSMLLVCSILFAPALSGCQKTEPEPSGEGDLREVTVILDYTVNTNHTGLYVAKKLGYYEEAGLNVNIIEPADGVTPTLVATGKGEFGVTYQEDLTYARAADQPLPIKAIATLIQHNTSGFATAAEKNITGVKDFEGKIYAGWGSPSEEAVIHAVMDMAGADFSKLTMVVSDSVGYYGLQDQYDIMWTFEAWDMIAAKRDGVDLNYFAVRSLDPRLDYYTPILIASEDTIEKDPELVRAFLAATEKGYRYAIENPESAAEILHETADTIDLGMLTESQQYLAGKYMEDTDTWGLMKAEVWDNYTDFMMEYNLIAKDVPAEDCFTNEFLPGVGQ